MSESNTSTWLFPDAQPDQVAELATASGLSRLAALVCYNRGIQTKEKIDHYLHPKLDALTHPFRILNLEKAATEIFASQHAPQAPSHEPQEEQKKKLRVFTDYDVDGTTGAALLSWFFRDMGFRFDVVQPDRFRDGYGLGVPAVEDAHRDGVHTLITVDCGITNFAAMDRARELGITVIIVDHHQIDPVKGVPEVFAAIDPQQEADDSGLKQLCGCALAFYLCMGIRIKAREASFFNSTRPEPNLRDLLDLVVLATAADMVPLIGDNRILVKQGLDVLRSNPKPGLKALMDSAGIEVKTVSPMSLGFALGPRINASGRMGSAETAYRCLTTKDPNEAQRLARELETVNQDRQVVQNQIWDQVREVVTKGLEAGRFAHAIVVASADWHEGVVGIVASRVTEFFKKPAVIMAIRKDGLTKGSARSYGGYSVLDALHASQAYLKTYGGHKYAAGVSLDEASLDAFCQAFNDAISIQVPSKTKGKINLEGSCDLSELTPKNLEELENLGPFGPGNPEPIFSVHAWVETQSVLKGRHLKLKLCEPPWVVEGIWFNAAERQEWMFAMEKSAQMKIRRGFAGIPELNRFRGRVTPTLRIKDLAPE